MRFSLAYQKYRLLDVKALTEYHLNCLACSKEEQAKLFSLMTSDQISGQKSFEVREGVRGLETFCRDMFSILDHSTLKSFELLCNTVLYKNQNEDDIILVERYIDLADYRHFFEKLIRISEAEIKLLIETIENDYSICMRRFFNDDSFSYQVILNSLLVTLKSTNLAEALDTYLIEHIIESYTKIWFGTDTVLTIYAQAPIVKDYVMSILNSECAKAKLSPVSYGRIEQSYLAHVRSLTFEEQANCTTVYRLYIGNQLNLCQFYKTMCNELKNNISVLVSKDGDGKAVALCEQRINQPQFETVAVETPELEPGVLLDKINAIDFTTIKQAARKKEAVSLFLNRTGFAFSDIEKCKYLVQNKYRKTGTIVDNLTWVYTGTYQIMEPNVPLQHMLSFLLNPEFKAKEAVLESVWKECKKNSNATDLSFHVCLPDSVYTSLSTRNADNSSSASQKAFVQYAVNTIAGNTHIIGDLLKTVVDFYNSPSISEEYASIPVYNKLLDYSNFRCVVNEAWLLDAYLRTKGESLAKFWYEYLSNDYLRDDVQTKLIMNAYNFITDTRDRHISSRGPICINMRYPANEFVAEAQETFLSRYLQMQENDTAIQRIHLYTITTTELSNLAYELSRTDINKTTAFAMLRKSAIEASHYENSTAIIEQSNKLGVLRDPAKILTDFIGVIKTIFCETNYYTVNLNLKSVFTDASDFLSFILRNIDETVPQEKTAKTVFDIINKEININRKLQPVLEKGLIAFAYSLLYTLPLDYQFLIKLSQYVALVDSADKREVLVSVLLNAISDVEFASAKLSYVKQLIDMHINAFNRLQLLNSLITSINTFVSCINSIFAEQPEFNGFSKNGSSSNLQDIADATYLLILTANTVRTLFTSILDALDQMEQSSSFSSSEVKGSLDLDDIMADLERVSFDNSSLAEESNELKNDGIIQDIISIIADAQIGNLNLTKNHSAFVWLIGPVAKFYYAINSADFEILTNLLSDKLYLRKDYRGYTKKKAEPVTNETSQGLYTSIEHILNMDSAYTAYLLAGQINRNHSTQRVFSLKGYKNSQRIIDSKHLYFICDEDNNPCTREVTTNNGSFIYYLHYTGLYIREYSDNEQPLCLTESE